MIDTGQKILSAPSALMTGPCGRDHRFRILKMLKVLFEFLRSQYFLTLSPIWFFGLMKILHIATPHPLSTHTHTHTHTHPRHVKIKVTEFSRNKMCNIRRANLSGDKSFYMPVWKKGLYVTGSGVHLSVNFLISGQLLLQFTSDNAETWYIVRSWCGAGHIVSGL